LRQVGGEMFVTDDDDVGFQREEEREGPRGLVETSRVAAAEQPAAVGGAEDRHVISRLLGCAGRKAELS